MFFTSRCFSFPLGVSADDRLTSNHIQSRKQTTRGATAGGERKERKKTSEREEGWRDGKHKKNDGGGGDGQKEREKEGKKATEANRCLRGHINHTLPVWQIDRSLANLPQCTD